jgi:hypothetical protein
VFQKFSFKNLKKPTFKQNHICHTSSSVRKGTEIRCDVRCHLPIQPNCQRSNSSSWKARLVSLFFPFRRESNLIDRLGLRQQPFDEIFKKLIPRSCVGSAGRLIKGARIIQISPPSAMAFRRFFETCYKLKLRNELRRCDFRDWTLHAGQFPLPVGGLRATGGDSITACGREIVNGVSLEAASRLTNFA